MDENTRKVMFSSHSDEYETPTWLFDALNNVFNFTLDPAASELSHMCSRYYTLNDNGLLKSWAGETVFINPPYSEAKKWIKRASEEYLKNGTEIVMLIPARTETKYWHDYIWGIATHVLFLRGRLKFINKTLPSYKNGGKPSSAPYPSAVIVYSNRVGHEATHSLRALGHLTR